MNKSYQFYNIIFGWSSFAIALITYILTVEPTASFWDCGEFLASSYKLEVGHPPGAPLFMLLGRFFALFTSNTAHVALAINMVSVLASAFTILFLFWTITHLAKKIAFKSAEPDQKGTFAVMTAGFIGAAAYTFSDTFWFSAVEAEVYASSSFFTAIVFWAILKWENEADEPNANRWLIFIAYMMGLSIGVHLLNLLTIPAIVFVYYFRKYRVSKKGIATASAAAVLILGFIMYGIIPGAVNLAAQFELMFVNGFGLPYHSGMIFYIVLILALLALGIYLSHKNGKAVLNTVFLGTTVILLGYSTFAIVVIRASANTPMNENQPDNAFSLLSYLNREQYGDRPLVYGPYYTADYLRDDDGNVIAEQQYTYIPFEGKYLKINKTNPKYDYDSKAKTLFPRMYSRDPNHVSAYQTWGNVEQGENPNLLNNMAFFFKYQLGHMYFRYLMWNFAGRQNDRQGHGSFLKGNWITGIPFIDMAMTGPQAEMTDEMKNSPSRNRYFLLPFLLGFLGFFYSLKNSEQRFSIIALLFFFTGIAIVIYLNQTPYQPRERDYAYAGSFYAFTIWIGLGVLSIYRFFEKKISLRFALPAAILLSLPVPTLMAAQNWDDHDRSGRYTARDFASNYLNSCEKNAILFTFGDNDTFPLWYAQEVEGIRTDVRVVNLSLLGTDWYINQMRRKAYDSDPIEFSFKPEQYRQGKRDAMYLTDDGITFADAKYYDNETRFKPQFDSLNIRLISLLRNSKYAGDAAEEFGKLERGEHQLSPEQTNELIEKISNKKITEKYAFDVEAIAKLKADYAKFIKTIEKESMPLTTAMDFAASEEEYAKVGAGTEDEMSYVPSKYLSLSVNKENVLKSGRFSDSEIRRFQSKIRWKINKNYLLKNDWAVLEIIARNNWKRPVYFATSVNTDDFLGLQDYFRLEGFAYRLVPYKAQKTEYVGSVNSEILFENLMNRFNWGRIEQPDVLVEENNLRVVSVMEIRSIFARCAQQLILDNQIEKTEAVLDRCTTIFPHNKVPFDETILPILETYYRIGAESKADKIFEQTLKYNGDLLRYFKYVHPDFMQTAYYEKENVVLILKELKRIAAEYKREKNEQSVENVLTQYN